MLKPDCSSREGRISRRTASDAIAQINNPFSSTPSFGLIGKKNVTLHSKLPPIYNATGQTVSIKSEDALLTIQIEKQLTQSDTTIHVGDLNADLLIECSVSQSTPIHTVTVKTDNGSEEHQQGTLSVIFRISQLRKKLVVKSDVATSVVDEVTRVNTNATPQKKVFGLKVPSTGAASTANKQPQFHSTMDAQNYLVDQVARKIASYVVTTETTVTVPLAVGGALNGPNKLADSALWPRYKEALEEQTPASDAKADSYRTYNIGVADEALGYTAQDSKSAITFLEQASNEYSKAIEAKPEEKNFIQAQSRIKAALGYYSDIGKLQPMSAGKAPLTTSLVATPAAAEGALSNKDVVDMVQAHLDEANIVDTVLHASDINFDLTPQGQIALTKAGVNGSILGAMKQRTRGTAPSQPLGRKR